MKSLACLFACNKSTMKCAVLVYTSWCFYISAESFGQIQSVHQTASTWNKAAFPFGQIVSLLQLEELSSIWWVVYAKVPGSTKHTSQSWCLEKCDSLLSCDESFLHWWEWFLPRWQSHVKHNFINVPSQSAYLNPAEHLCPILDWSFTQHSPQPPPSSSS